MSQEPDNRISIISDLCAERFERYPTLITNGFFSVLPAEQSKRARNAIFVNAGDSIDQLQFDHSRSGAVHEPRIYFLEQALIAGQGYVIYEHNLVVDSKQNGFVLKDFALRDGFFDGIYNKTVEKLVDRPLLSIIGPGYPIWGHWLLDFLPRLNLAQNFLGYDLSEFVIPLPDDTPRWVYKLIRFFTGLNESNFIIYDRKYESVRTSKFVAVPTLLHTDYFLHSSIGGFYDRFISLPNSDFPRKICVSRGRFAENRSVIRRFPNQLFFEQTARNFGYDIIYPEEHTFREQINFFSNALSVVGEYGSGMHNTIFSPAHTTVGQFIIPSMIQSRIAALRDHSSIFLLADNSPRFDTAEVASMEVSEHSITDFFRSVEGQTQKSLTRSSKRDGTMLRSHVIEELLNLYSDAEYLEIGVNTGTTFNAIKAKRKVAVDPKFLFNVAEFAEPDGSVMFREIESDDYFGTVGKDDKFDVIYLDGLHTFEQTLRDFCNAVMCIKKNGLIVIDDILPNSYHASLSDLSIAQSLKTALYPTDPDVSWMGDVYRLVAFIETFFQQFSFACIEDNHGQMIVWPYARPKADVPRRSVQNVAQLPFESVVLNKEFFRWRSFAETKIQIQTDLNI